MAWAFDTWRSGDARPLLTPAKSPSLPGFESPQNRLARGFSEPANLAA